MNNKIFSNKKGRIRLWNIVIVILVLALIVLFSIKNSEKNVSNIKLGFIGPLSGDGAVIGENEMGAIEIALEEINSAGGISGRPLEVIYEDGKCVGKDAATAANKLINVDDVKIIFGGACSTETLGAAPITEEARVILFSAFSSSPDIRNAGDYIFRTIVSDIECARPLLSHFAKYKKLAMITENSDYSQGIRKDFIPELQNLGVEIVADEVYSSTDKDPKTYLTKIKEANPEALFINPATSPAMAELIVKRAKELGIDVQLYGNFIIGSGNIVKNVKEELEGTIFYDVPILEPENKKAMTFITKYKSKYGDPYSEWDVGARYDTVNIIADALRKCEEDTDCIKDYLYNMPDYSGTIGTYHFDETGDNSGVYCSVYKIVDGKRVRIGIVE